MSLQTEDSGKAFALVVAAGAATMIGASAVFFPQLVQLANRKTLSASLAFAAGVMLYVSLVDIYGKSVSGFEDAGHDEDKAFRYTTLTFFAGVLLMKVLDILIKMALKEGEYSPERNMEQFLECLEENKTKAAEPSEVVEGMGSSDSVDNNQVVDEEIETNQMHLVVDSIPSKQLFHMGFATAVAIAIHNFPEGLVTFVAYVGDPAVGIALAAGIAIHNIPEGLCVAMPISYATGSRLKGFLWGSLSGISEPLGALVGWVALNGSFSGNAYGIMFGLVSGIMTFICVDELIPTACKHDKDGKIVTPCVFTGMAIIAGSLMLFGI